MALLCCLKRWIGGGGGRMLATWTTGINERDWAVYDDNRVGPIACGQEYGHATPSSRPSPLLLTTSGEPSEPRWSS